MIFQGFIALAKGVLPEHTEYLKSAKDELALFEFILSELEKRTIPEEDWFRAHNFVVLRVVARDQIKYLTKSGKTIWETKAKK